MLVAVKAQCTENNLVECILPDNTSKETISAAIRHIDRLLNKYEKDYDGDFGECDYYELVEKAFSLVGVEIKPVKFDMTVEI